MVFQNNRSNHYLSTPLQYPKFGLQQPKFNKNINIKQVNSNKNKFSNLKITEHVSVGPRGQQL